MISSSERIGVTSAGAGLIGMFGDPPHQRQSRDRRGEENILPRLKIEPDPDRDLGESVELRRIEGGGDFALMRCHGHPGFEKSSAFSVFQKS